MEKTIIVMPVANEEATMNDIIEQIMELPYDELYLYPIIDDYSQDRTETIIRDAEKKYHGRVKCVYYRESKGLISCYLHGFKIALQDGADRIIEMDGGGSHKPCELPYFIKALDEGYECVWGSRFMPNGAEKNVVWYRRMLSRGGTLLANFVLKTNLLDMTSGYEAFQADVLRKLHLEKFLSTGHMYQTEMKYYCRKCTCKEVPIHYIGGTSSLRFKSVLEACKILFCLKKNEKIVKDE